MIKNLSIFVLVLLLIPVLVQAQNKKFVPKANVVVDNQVKMSTSTGFSIASENYVLVDSMANAYGPAIATLNPLAYDPGSDVVAFVHRGHSSYAAGSGQLWYNISTDQGVTWQRVGPLQTDPIAARYPSMAISNPTGGDINGTIGLFSWPELVGGAFGGVGYGADQPLGAGTTFNAVISNSTAYSSQVPCWAEEGSTWMFWESDNSTDAAIEIWRTEDFGTVASTIIPSSALNDGGEIVLGGVGFNGLNYLGAIATFTDPDTANPIQFGWYPGYFTSTDHGVTWDNGTVVDFRTIPALSAYDQLTDYDPAAGTIRFDGDINIDKDGHLHMALGVTDTNTTPWTNSLVDVFQTASGWDATIVANLVGDPYVIYHAEAGTGVGLGQMGYSCYIAFDAAREVMAYQWIDQGTSPYADVFLAYKKLGETTWSAPMNLTMSDSIDNTQAHLAPTLSGSAGSYKAFTYYGYAAGENGPEPDPAVTANVYIAAVPFNTAVGVNDPAVINSFDLGQNYPNPFNPSTLIRYSLAEKSPVVLKVFDLLGREVATLVNSTQEAGNHSINFDASKLSSGMYVYTINAGNFSSSKKMMLMK